MKKKLKEIQDESQKVKSNFYQLVYFPFRSGGFGLQSRKNYYKLTWIKKIILISYKIKLFVAFVFLYLFKGMLWEMNAFYAHDLFSQR